MNFDVEELPIPGARVLRAPVRGDERGAFIKTFHANDLDALGIAAPIAEQYYSVSHRGVIRGMHFQTPPADHEKLVHCSRGSALDVLLDLRAGTPTYGTWCSIDLTARDGAVVYIPRGVAHGFQAREDETVLHYAVSTVYAPECDAGVRWDSAGIEWERELEPIVSERDMSFPTLDAFASPFVGVPA